ncbi:MAG: hypothetical protein O7F76_05130, partial [Planctomycetota bacterium]|nr:hypothetical protein [Planctomycetota bacterium]
GLAMTASVDTEKPSTESIEAEPPEARDANTAEIAVTTATAPVDDDAQGPGSAAPTNVQTSISELPSEEKSTDPEPDEPDGTDSSVAESPRVEATAEAGAEEIEWTEPEPDLVDDAQHEIEVAVSGPSISEAARTEPESVGLIETDTDDAATEAQPATEPERARVFRTCVLLSTEWRPATVVVHASLRRAGQRNAQLIPGRESDEPVMLDVGGTLLEVVLCPAPLDQATIEFAAAQSFDWPEAEAEVAGHVAHIIFTTRAFEETDRAEIVRIHHRAQAALTEFARVQAALWPDAGRLVPADDLARLAAEVAETASPIGTCITLRTFPPEGDASTFVCDTVGLHGFGLPDVEIVSEDEPDEGVSAALSELSGRIFVAGCDAAEGGPVALSDGSTWLASRGNARFAPSRAVIELRRVDGSEDRTTESDEGTPPEDTGD